MADIYNSDVEVRRLHKLGAIDPGCEVLRMCLCVDRDYIQVSRYTMWII